MPERVVCIADKWTLVMDGRIPPAKPTHPVKDEIYTVDRPYDPGDGKKYYLLVEFPAALYCVDHFRPVCDIGGLVEEYITGEMEKEHQPVPA